MTQQNRKASHTRLTRLTALVAVIAVFVGSAVWSEQTQTSEPLVSAETAEELRDQKQDILDRQQELETLRDQSAATLEEYEAQKAVLQQQIDLKVQEIALNEQMLSTFDVEIENRAAAIAQREAELEERSAQLQQRLRALSKTTSLTSMLQMLISSNNFTQYLVNTKAMERFSAETQAMIETLETDLQTLNAEKAVFEEQAAPYRAIEAELEAAKKELDVLYSELTQTTDKLHNDIEKYNADIAQAQADADALDEKIDELIRESVGGGQSFLSGSMYWPAADCNYISSTFKYRWGRWHRGIDICGSGCYGTQINAAADGVVSYAGWMSGYGNCVMINHGTDAQGRNITTLYAHSSALYVSKGQTVYGGQHIAAIGTTGNVTGPHLHFEIRVNGTAVDPIGNGYISTVGVIVDESL